MDVFPADGLMGLAFPSISDFNAPPLMHSLIAQQKVNDSSFSFKLAKNGSELFIGGADHALYKGNFTYMNVTEEVRLHHSVLNFLSDADRRTRGSGKSTWTP